MRVFGTLVGRQRRLYGWLLANFVIFGFSITLIGATVPAVIREFSWSYWVTGAVMSAGALGYLCSTFGCGLLVRLLGPKPVIVAGLLCQGAGFACFGLSQSALLNGAALVLIGLGKGGSELVSNYAVVRLERDGRGRLMNLLHAIFTVGAILGPLVVAALFLATGS